MGELYPSKTETTKILRRLQQSRAEGANVDAKETLNLQEAGDGASFIRHVAALANTGQSSYILIGVADKTWELKGIPEGSPLRAVDSTQQQMNQLLTARLDPPISVGYRTYEIDGFVIGVVGLRGTTPPYIVSMSDSRYGGAKSKGNDSYIYRGMIYVRRGADSIAASRQSELLAILSGRIDGLAIGMTIFFISVLVGAGVGVVTSVVPFADLAVPILVGCLWGSVIGWIFDKRLAEAMGRLTASGLGKILKNIGGALWGGFVGGFLSYMVVSGILSGKVKPLNPIFMGLVIVPILAIMGTVVFIGSLYLLAIFTK